MNKISKSHDLWTEFQYCIHKIVESVPHTPGWPTLHMNFQWPLYPLLADWGGEMVLYMGM